MNPTEHIATRGRLLRRPYAVRGMHIGALPAIVGIAFTVRLWLATLPLRSLVAHVTPDDAFYYFAIARNIAGGRGVTFDGAVATNGFHPLWMAIVTICYKLPSPGIDPMRLALAVSAAISAAGAIALYRLVEALTHRKRIALAGAAVYALHPAVALQSVNGLETGIALTALLFCAGELRRTLDNGAPLRGESSTATWRLGVAGGLLVLARTDYALFFAAMLVFVLWKRGLPSASRAGAIAAAVATPWFIWSITATGSLLQTSGEAVPVIAHGAGPHGADAVPHALRLLRTAWTSEVPAFYLVAPDLHWWGVAALACAGLALAALVVRRRRIDAATGVLLSLAAGVVALTIAHAAVRWYFRDWYLPALAPLLILVCARSLASIPERWPRVSALAGALLAAAAIGSAASFGWREYREPRYEFQLDILTAARWSRDNTPPGAVIGSFNAGIVGYISGRQTVNLDGVVDGDALDAIRGRRLLAYADRRCVTHLADFPFYLFWYQRYWGGDGIAARITPVKAFSEATSRQPEAIAVDFTIWRYDAATPCD
jgi:GAF domain-containing protein